MGICKVLTTDQGTEFNNKLNKELMRTLGIDHRLTLPIIHRYLKLIVLLNCFVCRMKGNSYQLYSAISNIRWVKMKRKKQQYDTIYI